jgi:hypothetical protein
VLLMSGDPPCLGHGGPRVEELGGTAVKLARFGPETIFGISRVREGNDVGRAAGQRGPAVGSGEDSQRIAVGTALVS